MSFHGLVRALRAAKEEGSSLEKVPAVFWVCDTWSSDFFLELAGFHWSAICFMPTEEFTEQIAREVVSQAACSLRFVPIDLHSRELYPEATKRDISVLDATPIEFAEGMLTEWLNHNSDTSDWSRIPLRFRTDEFTLRALQSNPLIIDQIPKESHMHAVCDAFLRGGGHEHYLEDVKPEARSRILCIACLKENSGPLDAVPRLLWGPDITEADHIGKLHDDPSCNDNSAA